MRLLNISTIEEANCWHPTFIEGHNRKFGKLPINPRNAHRALMSHEKLEETFCWQEERTLSNNLTFQYKKILYLYEDTPANRKIARKHVTVYDYPDGSIEVRYNGRPLPYSILHDRLQRIEPGEVVESKRLGNVMKFIIEKQAELNCERSKSVPRKRA